MIREYVNEVSRRYGITYIRVIGAQRSRELVRARDIVAALAYASGYTNQQIGDVLGGRDHTTIIAARQRAARNIRNDAYFRNVLLEVEAAVNTKRSRDLSKIGAGHERE
jgi:chromosomal replication initiation ATPase DnaA